MELIIVFLCIPAKISYLSLVYNLRLNRSKFNEKWFVLRDARLETRSVKLHIGFTSNWSRKWRDFEDGELIDERYFVGADVVLPIDRDLEESGVDGVPSWGSAPNLVREKVLVVLADGRSLHNGIGGDALSGVILTGEPTGDIGELSESLEVISIAPKEICFDHQRLILVGIGK